MLFIYFKIHLCSKYALLLFSNSLKMHNVHRNMLQLRQTVCKNIVISLVHFFILLSEWVRRGGCIGSWWGNWREGDLGVDGWIILGWICRGWDVGIWTGLG